MLAFSSKLKMMQEERESWCPDCGYVEVGKVLTDIYCYSVLKFGAVNSYRIKGSEKPRGRA